jgi:indole-3-glycerol phosphate synthase
VSASQATVLQRIISETRAELQRRVGEVPRAELERRATDSPEPSRSLIAALSGPAMGVIAEFKRRSPSAGALAESPDLHEVLAAYVSGGAAAASILTEGPNFAGSLKDLRDARAACDLPLLRKDFIVDEYQLMEARAAGADAVLLIVAALSGPELQSLHTRARSLGLEVLVEVHDEHELELALEAGAELVGINNRDLRDFTVDTGRTERLMSHVPGSVTAVSESGISDAGQVASLAAHGVRGVLVGEALMRAADPTAALRALVAVR